MLKLVRHKCLSRHARGNILKYQVPFKCRNLVNVLKTVFVKKLLDTRVQNFKQIFKPQTYEYFCLRS